MPKFAFRSDDPERITGVTIKVGREIHSLPRPALHADIPVKLKPKQKYEEGFSTNKRPHISRVEAMKVANKSEKLIEPARRYLEGVGKGDNMLDSAWMDEDHWWGKS